MAARGGAIVGGGLDRVDEWQPTSDEVCLDDVGEGATVVVADFVVTVLTQKVVGASGDADPHLRQSSNLS